MYNVWFAVRDTSDELLKIARDWDAEKSGEPYVGPVSKDTLDVYSKVADPVVGSELFKKANLGGVTIFGRTFFASEWRVWSIYTDSLDDIEKLTSRDSNTYAIGVWDVDTGKPAKGYEVDTDILLFCPDGTLESANILFGQATRQM